MLIVRLYNVWNVIKKNRWDITKFSITITNENINYGLVRQNLETNYNFYFKDSKRLVYLRNKKKSRKMAESVIISKRNNLRDPAFLNFISISNQISAKNI